MSQDASCLTCHWAKWTGRPEESNKKDPAWGDCTFPGIIPGAYLACYIHKLNPHPGCPGHQAEGPPLAEQSTPGNTQVTPKREDTKE
jgi:hypothetical protein